MRGTRWGDGTRRLVLAVAVAAPLALAGAQAAQASWTLESPVIPHGITFSSFRAVSCASVTDCVAVGTGSGRNGAAAAIIEKWNGANWTLQTPAIPPGDTSLQFNAVSCPSVRSCTVVGTYNWGAVTDTLAERWNGTRWNVQRTPEPFESYNDTLAFVSCVSATSCLADGEGLDGPNLVPIAESWNGKTWTLVSSPPSGIGPLSCTSATSCTGVGVAGNALVAASWDGSTWTSLPAPAVPAGATLPDLPALWCGSATDCVAVGDYKKGGFRPLEESWNGTGWTQMATAFIPDRKEAFLSGVSCAPAGGCTAVGNIERTTFPKGTYQTFAEHWSGTKWTVRPTVAPAGAPDSWLAGVSCHSACTAVGSYVSGRNDVLLAERTT